MTAPTAKPTQSATVYSLSHFRKPKPARMTPADVRKWQMMNKARA